MASALLLACTLHLLLLSNANTISVTITDLQDNNDAATHPSLYPHFTSLFGFHTKDISFEGSHIQGVALHASTYPDDDEDGPWSVTAPLVYALPNQGSVNGLMNEAEVYEKIVLFDRSENEADEAIVSLSEQVYTAQHAGAVAVIIVDFPACAYHEKHTALQAAIKSDLEVWKSLTIPSVVVRFERGERLKSR